MKKISCHCGQIKIQVNIQEFGKLQRCNCSICRKKGSIMAAVDLKDLKILKGEKNLSMYQFNKKVAKHYFCKTCGIYTHHQRRSNPNEFAINVGCIDEIDPYDYFKLNVENNDGNNHILDRKK
tara:strand:- start:693 stop:1061 length:369 start_codon:yes stop_codon:yes gene_type:complete